MGRRPAGLAAAAAVALAAAAPYLAGGLPRTFILLDDPEYVAENPFVLGGLSVAGLRWALTTFHAGNWHPLTWLSHMLDVSLFGLHPLGHHATSVALHALATALVFVALRRLTGARWPSLFAALFFGLHPLRVESVAWVAERKDVLAGLFFALVLVAYERHVRAPGRRRYLLVPALMALGLMAKPMLVTVPLVLLLLDYWPLGRLPGAASRPASTGPAASWGPVLLEKVPLVVLSGVFAVVATLAQSAVGTVAATGELPVGTRLANAAVSVAAYAGATLWPASLAVYYPYPDHGHPWWKTAAAAAVLIAALAFLFRSRRRRPYLTVGGLWFLCMLVPVIGLVQIGQQARADRYTYLPSLGLCICAAWAGSALCASARRARAAVFAAAVVALAACAALTVRQVGFWRDSETLFRRALAVTADNWVVHNNLGIVLDRQGRFPEALANYGEVLRLRPGYADAHNNIGVTYMKTGRAGLGIAHFREAVRLEPAQAEARLNLARALAEQGRSEEAAAQRAAARRLQGPR
jgi:tetratricopeptide (TPR) repeat protein